jgi:hypothetical protein
MLSAVTIAQELEPRTYTNTPTEINLLSVGLLRSSGNVLLDPSLPIEDLDGQLNIAVLRYVRTFGLMQRAAKFKLGLPYATGDWEGTIDGWPAARSANGSGDVRLDLEWNFYGAPALRGRDFESYRQGTIVGTSLRVIAPTGNYQNDRLLNLGSNRWSVRPEIGVSRALGQWALELTGGVWLFGDNDDFAGGRNLEQDPLYVLKAHAVYSLRPGFWIGGGLGYGKGGRTRVDGTARDTSQQNYRFAVTLAYPLNKQHGVAVSLGTGSNSGAGADFDSLMLSYQFAWGEF